MTTYVEFMIADGDEEGRGLVSLSYALDEADLRAMQEQLRHDRRWLSLRNRAGELDRINLHKVVRIREKRQ